MTRTAIVLLATCFALAACGKPAGTAQESTAQGSSAGTAQSAPAAESPAQSADAATLSADQLAAALKVLDKALDADGKVMNDCDEKVTPGVYAADVGGDVGRAWLIQITGGPTTIGCYGNAGNVFWLMRRAGDSFEVIFQSFGLLAIMPGEHMGVKDIAVGGPGFSFPVYAWDGAKYAPSGTIKDTELPPPINM